MARRSRARAAHDTSHPQLLVTTDWLAAHLSAPDLRILDASWYLPAESRDARAEFEAAHIPGARFFDIDEIADTESGLPHMAPPVEKFVARMRALGIGDGHRVIVYDGAGIFSAPRVWWLFRLFGKTDVAVLDGGLPKWRAEGRPVEDVAPDPARPPLHRPPRRRPRPRRHPGRRHRQARRRPDRRRPLARALPRRGARAAAGPALRPHPRREEPALRTLLNPDGTMKDPAGLRAAFAAAGSTSAKPAITTCGSGVTPAILSLALERLGNRSHALYDGSWAEWGAYPDLKVKRG